MSKAPRTKTRMLYLPWLEFSTGWRSRGMKRSMPCVTHTDLKADIK
jgi:hypothetical protein